jgi:hypothetical protein
LQQKKKKDVKMKKVLLVTLSAKNIHKTLAPWCLKAYIDANNCYPDFLEYSEERYDVCVFESSINDNIGNIIVEILEAKPNVIGFSCYIWNINIVREIAANLRKLLPDCKIYFGGPEPIDNNPIAENSIKLSDCPSPYTDEFFASFAKSKMSSIANQLIYYESSRGCPYSCSFCLSSVNDGVEYLPLDRVKTEINILLSNGARCLKFVDRTFNSNKKRALEIFKFIFDLDTDCTFHFEVAADLFDDEQLEIISKMPIGRVQFEAGIQSVNPKTIETVCRKTDIDRALANIGNISSFGNCHIHVDLIAGLPHDSVATFAEAINRCLAAKPHMLQIGFLKMLKGSAMREYADNCDEYKYFEFPPYEVLQSNSMSNEDIGMLKKIEEVVDKYYNSCMASNSIEFASEKLFCDSYTFFKEFAHYYCENVSDKSSMKAVYTLLRDFLVVKFPKEKLQIEHFIKLDCLLHDPKGMMPDEIGGYRDKGAEADIRGKGDYKNIRVEKFVFDGSKRLFIYNKKNVVTNAYDMIILQLSTQKNWGHINHG